ncbi:lysostaphin resistance A-like protein [Catenovulum sp. SX2]|uniref:CPBP family intramembrane glutamic endopeptidase n=1 Tax=Catenovulum sp. SX2 TaxID=3398614 RepID=UPI003F8353CC
MDKNLKIIGTTLITFVLYQVLFDFCFQDLRSALHQILHIYWLSHIISYLIVGIPLIIGLTLIAPRQQFFQRIGLSASITQAALVALLFTSPMFMGYGYFYQFNTEVNLDKLITGVICAGFFEEVYFRGFLFGILYRYTRLGFIPAIIFGAVLFALGHMHQSTNIEVLIGVFISTFLGAIFFAWLYCEWQFNLWIAIFMHMFMNLAWMMFDVSNNAFGGEIANIFRFCTIIFAIVGTVIYKKYHKQFIEISKVNLWIKPLALSGLKQQSQE